MDTYHIRTYGCQMNTADSERLESILQGAGLKPAADIRAADMAVLNTCSVRAKPENKVRGMLHELKSARERNPEMFIAVIGCMAELRPELGPEFPFVDLVMGSTDFPALVRRLQSELELRGRGAAAPAGPAPGAVKALVPVVRGCSNRCAYCVVPDARGPEQSRPLDEVVEECRRLAELGVVEITLLGQNVLAWGLDSGQGRFMDLLEAVHEFPSLRRLGFLTSHPRDFTPELARELGRLPKLCDYFHFPLQAGDDAVLERMGRGYDSGQYLERVAAIRDAFPGAAVSSDFIVGFPGESEAAFERTLEIFKLVRFDWAYVFKYSVRPGTPAALVDDDVPAEEKTRRHAELMALHDRVCLENNLRMVGRTVDVFVDEPPRPGAPTMLGRTTNNKKVAVPADPGLLGRIVPVRITQALTWTLRGEPA